MNYFGQAAWLLEREGSLLKEKNPFFEMMPQWFLIQGIVIATAAAIVASQALISGSVKFLAESQSRLSDRHARTIVCSLSELGFACRLYRNNIVL